MTKAVFLSAAGDPFIALTVIKFFQDRWYGEVDKFYVCYNNHCGVPDEVVNEFVKRISKDPKIAGLYFDHGIGNGQPINEMLKDCTEDLVLLLEDDGFLFTPGKVKEAFEQIESGQFDALGSPRFSCGQEIAEALKQKYNLDYSGYGDKGPTFWPNFFFCKKEDLLKTDQDFGSHEFKAGEYIPELDHTMAETQYGDTFVWASIQLRNLGLKFGEIPQFHASPREPEEKEAGEMNWINGIPYWIHGGSLSTSWNGYLSGNVPDLSNENAILEIETRVSFWQLCSDVIEGFDDFRIEYKAGIEQLIANGRLDVGRIKKKYDIYRALMKV